MSPLAALLPRVVDIADAAAACVMDVYRAAVIEVHAKQDASPVTQADLAAHRCIAVALARLTPSIPIVSEEDAASLQWRRPDACFWLIDPLDGTKEFIARNDEFTVNIALIDQGWPVLGVVAAPALRLCYWGAQGLGAFCRHAGGVASIRVATPARPLRVVASKSHMNEATQQHLAQLGEIESLQIGSSLKFCLIAEGKADYHPRLGPTCEWDTAAAQAVLEAAGGSVRTLAGERLAYGKPDVVNPFYIANSTGLEQAAC